MATKARNTKTNLDADNAAVLAEIVVEPTTQENLKVQILNKLMEGAESADFFDSMFAEKLSYGACPHCHHYNHWLVPEDELNKRGFVSNEEDPRIERMTTKKDCERWQEACKKKKINV